ncbi:kinase-like domain-containing protein [Phialemonium atrogriseum]|uniref:Kinase-like domain-containing protein n=1 Tax=Phialemonium atrogriseum TaxID=1093897 RepID=A0AAJ0C806_9PEZI|nr:kinase-like domain-containing protein [Phialemonium atrogriseum]KAK1770359.1 kinase-like domain-containing protein [Phialemonium atrogriseum]
MTHNPYKGKVELLGGPSGTWLFKAHEVWIDGKAYEHREFAFKGALEREAIIYARLGDHARITKCFGLREFAPGSQSLQLERASVGCARQYTTDHADKPPALHLRLRMAVDFAEGVEYLHEKGVTWCDLSARNALLFDNFRVKLCDFGGAVMTGSDFEEIQSYESRYETPLRGREWSDVPPLTQELYALGSAVYEITEWKIPYGDVPEEEIDAHIGDGNLPVLTEQNSAASIIAKCWREEYHSASAVVRDLQICFEESQPRIPLP